MESFSAWWISVAEQIDSGIKLLSELPGVGRTAQKGDRVTYNARFFLRRGDEVTADGELIASHRSQLDIRIIDDVELVDHRIRLGKRQPIAGVEKTLYGMRPGAYREVLVSAHLAYGEQGVGERIPPNAMLRICLWVQEVQPAA